jgi:acetyl-CoA acyltransferase
LTDGAAALLLASGRRAAELGLEPLGRIRAFAFAGLDPARMGLGPAFSVPGALDRAGVTLREIDRIELNEAFAAQVIANERCFASPRFAREELGRPGPIGEIDREILNVHGGAIALGHPVGATGARLVLTLLREMKRNDLQLGLATLCVGGGQGAAIVLERS